MSRSILAIGASVALVSGAASQTVPVPPPLWRSAVADPVPACPLPAKMLPSNAIGSAVSVMVDAGLTLDGPQRARRAACTVHLFVAVRNARLLGQRSIVVDVRYFELATGGATSTFELLANGTGPMRIDHDERSGNGFRRFVVPAATVAALGGVDLVATLGATRLDSKGAARIMLDTVDIDCPRRQQGGCP